MRFAICEDDHAAQQSLVSALNDWAKSMNINIDVLCYSNAEAFLGAWPDISFDLAFLDIELNTMTGLELAKLIRKSDNNMMIVFTTIHSQFMIDGYDVNALHYLNKPISKSRLLLVLDKAHTIWRSRNNTMLVVSSENGKMKLSFYDIYYISMFSHTASIHTEKDTYDLRKTAGELYNLLPRQFIRCHRSYIVNLFKVDCVFKSSLQMSNGTSLAISRSNSKLVNDAFVRLHTDSML